MNIMVFDVPAINGGALSVLNDFYQEVAEYEDTNINWIFVVSTPRLRETENIKVIRFPWIKKSWGHRLFFDQIIAPKLVKQYKVDKIFSLQNVIIPNVNCEQNLYVHQSLPFVDYKYSFRDNKLFWVYQNIVGRNIINSIKKAKRVIVQTKWMKQACMEKAQVDSGKINVVPPTINLEIKERFNPNDESLSTFFYPANGSEYKNHQVILEACKALNKIGELKYKVIFTLNGNENPYVADLYSQVQKEKLPIYFEGFKTREEVFDLFTKSILIFPSFIETYGLPLKEARMHEGIILASDTPFAREVLKGYANVKFFETFDSKKLSLLMYHYFSRKELYKFQTEDYDHEIEHNRKIITFLT
ncbi:glycosyltransferase [Peribacillus sp. NPDC076916]|uniref:glycosyltransferase n=1 Tax=Peribacillus sp. NPDC076916 TaxID=3390608 RepID=UPI003D07C189